MEANQKVFTTCQKNINRLAHQIAKELYKEQEAKKYNIDFLSYKETMQEDLNSLIKEFVKEHAQGWAEILEDYTKEEK